MAKQDPATEARRLAAVRAAASRPGYSQWSTGPRTSAGKRRAATNATKHGGDRLSVRLALAYAEAVLSALK